ncbi:MAG: PP2C family protein-serine/threonine phosphatase [Parabacteroides sp.]
MIQIQTNNPFVGFVETQCGGRPENQDNLGYADTPLGLLVVVCDGMGGGPGGKYASSSAVDIIIRVVYESSPDADKRMVLQQAIQTANQFLYQKVQENSALQGMGTTVTVLLIDEASAMVAHVGDSRVYQFRRGRKKFRTFDHSYVFELVKNGTLTEEQARLSEQSNVIMRALGSRPEVEAEIVELPYERKDRFMLCSDGIWGMLPEKELIQITASTPSLSGSVERLVIRINEIGSAQGGNHDNLTVALVETTTNSKLKEKMSTRTRTILWGLSFICVLSLALNVCLFNLSSMSSPGSRLTKEEQTASRTDSIIETRIKEERSRMEAGFQHILDSVSSMIDEKKRSAFDDYMTRNDQKKEIVNKLNVIIEQLEQLKLAHKSDTKSERVDDTIEQLKDIVKQSSKYGVRDADWHYKKHTVIDLLQHNIAKEDVSNEKMTGHYNAIIQVVKTVRNKIESK